VPSAIAPTQPTAKRILVVRILSPLFLVLGEIVSRSQGLGNTVAASIMSERRFPPPGRAKFHTR